MSCTFLTTTTLLTVKIIEHFGKLLFFFFVLLAHDNSSGDDLRNVNDKMDRSRNFPFLKFFRKIMAIKSKPVTGMRKLIVHFLFWHKSSKIFTKRIPKTKQNQLSCSTREKDQNFNVRRSEPINGAIRTLFINP